MKKLLISIFLLVTLLVLYYNISYSAEDNSKQSQALAEQARELNKMIQKTRPIVPPAVPAGVSAIPSPHIAVPTINRPTVTIPRVPTAPTRTIVPVTDASTALPQIPVVRNILGRIVNIEIEETGGGWIELKPEFTEQTMKIKVASAEIPVVKKTEPLSLKDIKIGDIVNILFNQTAGENIANFINLMTEEDLEMMKKRGLSGSTKEKDTKDTQ